MGMLNCRLFTAAVLITKGMYGQLLMYSHFVLFRLFHCTGNSTVGTDGVEMDSVGEEVSVWEKMMQYPDSWAEGTLPLRSTMGKTPKKGLQTLFSH